MERSILLVGDSGWESCCALEAGEELDVPRNLTVSRACNVGVVL